MVEHTENRGRKGIIYDCPWDDFRFNYSERKTATRSRRASRLGAVAGIKVELTCAVRAALTLNYVFLAAH